MDFLGRVQADIDRGLKPEQIAGKYNISVARLNLLIEKAERAKKEKEVR